MNFKFFSLMCSCYKIKNEQFDEMDDDADGRITLNEFHSYFLKKYGRPPTNDQWFKFHLADVNNNGYISKYDVEIFEKNIRLFN
jgi:Ca2+-binding EF-hand superfamily protein